MVIASGRVSELASVLDTVASLKLLLWQLFLAVADVLAVVVTTVVAVAVVGIALITLIMALVVIIVAAIA